MCHDLVQGAYNQSRTRSLRQDLVLPQLDHRFLNISKHLYQQDRFPTKLPVSALLNKISGPRVVRVCTDTRKRDKICNYCGRRGTLTTTTNNEHHIANLTHNSVQRIVPSCRLQRTNLRYYIRQRLQWVKPRKFACISR